jgi:hypothetical protein
LKLQYDELPSNFAFKCNLRRHTVARAGGPSAALRPGAAAWLEGVPQCAAVYLEALGPEPLDLGRGTPAPAPWWTAREDRGLLVGTLRHGFGRYDAMRADPELGLQVGRCKLKTCLNPVSASRVTLKALM